MRHVILAVKLLVYGYLAYLLYVLAMEYDPADPTFHPPFILFVVDWIDLFIHEAGHAFLKFFGQFIYIHGGSLIQILLPALMVLVTWRQTFKRGIGLPLFWLGENLVNVSVYIKDAPYKKLHLLAGGLIHDWNWLLNGNQEFSALLSDAVFGLGLLSCAAGIVAGIWFGISTWRLAADLDRIPAPPAPNRLNIRPPSTFMR